MLLDIVIGKTIPVDEVPKNCFIAKVEFYSGDADHSESVEAKFGVDKLEAFIAEINNIDRISESPTINDEIVDWSDEDQRAYYNTDDPHGIVYWPSDVFSDGAWAAKYDGFEIWFYDATGAKFDCEIKST